MSSPLEPGDYTPATVDDSGELVDPVAPDGFFPDVLDRIAHCDCSYCEFERARDAAAGIVYGAIGGGVLWTLLLVLWELVR